MRPPVQRNPQSGAAYLACAALIFLAVCVVWMRAL